MGYIAVQGLEEMIVQGQVDFQGNGAGELKIVFAGDFCPVNRVETLCREGNSSSIYGKGAIDLLKGGDIGIVNLECPLTDKPTPMRPLKNAQFCAKSRGAKILTTRIH